MYTLSRAINLSTPQFNFNCLVVPDEFKIYQDGILGGDFLKKFNAKIDYRTEKLEFEFQQNKLSISMRIPHFNKIISIRKSNMRDPSSMKKCEEGLKEKEFYEKVKCTESDNFASKELNYEKCIKNESECDDYSDNEELASQASEYADSDYESLHNDYEEVLKEEPLDSCIKNSDEFINVAVNCDNDNEAKDLQVIIPARTGKIITVRVDSDATQGIINKIELKHKLLMCNTLCKLENRTTKISIINVTEKDVTFNPPIFKMEEINLPNGKNIFMMNNSEKDQEENEKRVNELLDTINLTHLEGKEQNDIIAILTEYVDCFQLKNDKLSQPTYEFDIKLKADNKIIAKKQYRTAVHLKDNLIKEVKKLKENDIIENSVSPWNSPIILVPKKIDNSQEKKYRLVIDYRELNTQIEHDNYLLPNMHEILCSLGDNKYFTTLDWHSGFYQLGLKKTCRKYTAFSTPIGKFQMKRIPMGIKNSPATFQRVADNIFAGLSPEHCLIYLDDIIVYGRNAKEHNFNLLKVLKAIKSNGIKLNPDKCNFLKTEINYLGHNITSAGIFPDKQKLQGLLSLPVPKNLKELQRFLGIVNFYADFIENSKLIEIPLRKLLRKKIKFEWGPEQETAFNNLKNAIASAKCLAHPDLNKEFILTTDGSETGLGAILSQIVDGKERPIGFKSRATTEEEKKRHKFRSHEFECLALIFGIDKFRHFLLGKKFKVFTDNKALSVLKQKQNYKSPYMTRWALELGDYDFSIHHKGGKLIPHVDALSRSYNITVQDKERIFRECHDNELAGHRSIKDTIEKIKNLGYDWPGLHDEIRCRVNICPKCQLNKATYGKATKMPMALVDIPETPFHKIALDIVGPLPKTLNNNVVILTVRCLFTKFTFAIPLPNAEAETIANALINEIFLNFGFPKIILTDQGSNFMSKLFKNFCKLLNIKKINTTAFRPQSNGSVERFHRSLNEYLKNFTTEKNWDVFLKYATFAYNSTKNNATKYSPFF